VYNKLLRKNILDKLKGSKNLTLIIDSTNIYNKNSSENVGYGANPKKKNLNYQLFVMNIKMFFH